MTDATTFDAEAIAGAFGFARRGRTFAVEASASGFFVTGTDSGHRADAILHANQLTDPEAARIAIVGAIGTVGWMLDIDLAAEPA
jgi:hypothetical protein